MRMLAGRTGASGWLRGRRGPRGPGRGRPAGDTCRKRRADVKLPESYPPAARLQALERWPAVSEPTEDRNGAPAAIRRPLRAAGPAANHRGCRSSLPKAKPHSSLRKKDYRAIGIAGLQRWLRSPFPTARATAIPIEKGLHRTLRCGCSRSGPRLRESEARAPARYLASRPFAAFGSARGHPQPHRGCAGEVGRHPQRLLTLAHCPRNSAPSLPATTR